jgi:Bifunctional DNA primase/polymerase, N-terminal/AAA domain
MVTIQEPSDRNHDGGQIPGGRRRLKWLPPVERESRNGNVANTASENLVYRTSAPLYVGAGWSGVLPLPAGEKSPPPTGYTGEDGVDPDTEAIETWRRERGDGNVALRLPEDVVGIDVDNYDGKDGGGTLKALVDRWGPLPPTWISTSRRDTGDTVSGIRLYRIPAGLKLPGQAGAGIEIVQHHHRYTVVFPSVNPLTQRMYRWYAPDGEICERVPSAHELAELPRAWLEGLTETSGGTATDRAALAPSAEWSGSVKKTLGEALTDMATGMSRHGTVTQSTMALARLEERAHPGASEALEALGAVFTDAIKADRASPQEAAKEWGDLVKSARKKVAGSEATIPRYDEVRFGYADAEQWVKRNRTRRDRDPSADEGETEEPPWASLLMDGKAWLLSGSDKIEALWGNAQWVLAARRQPIVLAGESGSGKTTLTQHMILGAIGVPGYETLLGMAVTPTEGKVLLLASDRPDQARLSMWRHMNTEAWDIIEERLVVWQGPPPEDVGNNPFLLLDMARHAGATLVVPDSLKDMAVRLVDDNVGAAVNQAHQLLIADGRDVWVPHHLRKGGRQDKVSEITINDLYGSAHIFNGAGSVLVVDRCPTDYELRQLKSPNGEYPTLRYQLGADGSATLGGEDPFLFVVRQAGEMGISTKEVARAELHPDGSACPDADVQKARRRLNKLEDEGFITYDGDGPKRRWVAV